MLLCFFRSNWLYVFVSVMVWNEFSPESFGLLISILSKKDQTKEIVCEPDGRKKRPFDVSLKTNILDLKKKLFEEPTILLKISFYFKLTSAPVWGTSSKWLFSQRKVVKSVFHRLSNPQITRDTILARWSPAKASDRRQTAAASRIRDAPLYCKRRGLNIWTSLVLNSFRATASASNWSLLETKVNGGANIKKSHHLFT